MTPLNQTSMVRWYAASQVRAITRTVAIPKNAGNSSLIIVYTINTTINTTPNDAERLCTPLPSRGIGTEDRNGAFHSQRPIIKEKTEAHNWELVI